MVPGRLIGRRKPNGKMPYCILLYADDMVIFEMNRERMHAIMQMCIKPCRMGHTDEYPQDKMIML